MIAKLAFLTSPAPNRYLLNIQKFGSDKTEQIEISEGHLANIVIDGASFALRKSHRVPETKLTENASHGTEHRP